LRRDAPDDAPAFKIQHEDLMATGLGQPGRANHQPAVVHRAPRDLAAGRQAQVLGAETLAGAGLRAAQATNASATTMAIPIPTVTTVKARIMARSSDTPTSTVPV
jgi:hypothetical protein